MGRQTAAEARELSGWSVSMLTQMALLLAMDDKAVGSGGVSMGDGNDSFRGFTHRLRPACFPLARPTVGIASPHLAAFSSSRRPDSLSVPSAWR